MEREGPFSVAYINSTHHHHHHHVKHMRRGRGGGGGMSLVLLLSGGLLRDMPGWVNQKLRTIYLLHPGLQCRLFLATLGRVLVDSRVYGKVKYVSRVEYLWDHISKKDIELPHYLYQHDRYLEYRRPTMMLDYGLESDYPHCNRTFNFNSNSNSNSKMAGLLDVPPLSSYSMRCIS